MTQKSFFLLFPGSPSSLAYIFCQSFLISFSPWILGNSTSDTDSALTMWIICTTACIIYMFSESLTPAVFFSLFLKTVTYFTTNYNPEKKQIGSKNCWHWCQYFVLMSVLTLSSPAFPTHEHSHSSPGAVFKKNQTKTTTTWIIYFLCHEFSQMCGTTWISSQISKNSNSCKSRECIGRIIGQTFWSKDSWYLCFLKSKSQ